jgi:hypothetical protein
MSPQIDEVSAPVRLSYLIRVRNVGDRINPDLIESLLCRRVVHTSNSVAPHLLGFGSLFAYKWPGWSVRQTHLLSG